MSPDPLPPAPAHPRRIVYLGTPAMAVAPLQALVAAGFEVALVVTGADKRRRRRGEPTPTPVKVAAQALGLPVTHDLTDVASAGADLGVVVAYGRIIKRPLLEALPMVNLHFSLLPRWRGAAPVQRALLAGDDRTGVCVMAVEEGLDTGGVYASADVPIDASATAEDLATELVELGSALLADTLTAGLGAPTPQEGEPTYAAKITPHDLRLDWSAPASALNRVVRVGGAWTVYDGQRLKVLDALADDEAAGEGAPGALHDDQVTCGRGLLRLVQVQPAGKAPMAFAAWANGAQPVAGTELGHEEQP